MIAVFRVGALLLGLCAAVSAAAQTAATVGVVTAQASVPRMGTERQEIRAQLLPRRYTTLAAEIGAKVNALPVAESDAFAEGQLLIGFDCSLQQTQLQKAQAEMDAAAPARKLIARAFKKTDELAATATLL